MYKERISLMPRRMPTAYAKIAGSAAYPEISGEARFYENIHGTLIVVEVFGLPTEEGACRGRFLGLHIHAGSSCDGTESDPFSRALSHYNPQDCEHPHHAGDLPPLLEYDSYAFSAFIVGRVSVDEIIGKTLIIHASADDFSSQPAGHAGEKIACGEIVRLYQAKIR